MNEPVAGWVRWQWLAALVVAAALGAAACGGKAEVISIPGPTPTASPATEQPVDQ